MSSFTNPQECLCCDLKVGILVWGIISIILHLIGAGLLIYVGVEIKDVKDLESLYWVFLIIAIISIVFIVIKASFLVIGIGMEKMPAVTGFIVILYIEVVLGVINAIQQIFHKPASVIGMIIWIIITVYYIFCVKSFRNKLMERGGTVPMYPTSGAVYQPPAPAYQPQGNMYQPQANMYQPQPHYPSDGQKM